MGEKSTPNGRIYTGTIKRRLCLVLDCLTSHDFNPRNDELLNLQHHVIREKKLSEKESLFIFTDTVRIVAELHKRNIVHRDLKLGNLVLNRKTRKVIITNFCLGKHLASEKDLLKDQRGSPAYISPDVLCGKPYLGKPSDMWALGVVLFTMLYGQFPFYDSSPTQLFNKIKAANYHIPNDGRVSDGTINLIRNLLILQPSRRLTAPQVLDSLAIIIETFRIPPSIGEEEQVVPDITDLKDESISDKKHDLSEKSKEALRPINDLFKKINFQEQMLQLLHQSESPLPPKTRPYGQIPVHRIDSDPRELTQAELDRYKHLIPRDNQRQHIHSSSRRDGILRARSATRYRPTPSNPTQERPAQSIGSSNTQNNISDGQNPVENNSNVPNSRNPIFETWATAPSRSSNSSATSATTSSTRSIDVLHGPVTLASENNVNSVNNSSRISLVEGNSSIASVPHRNSSPVTIGFDTNLAGPARASTREARDSGDVDSWHPRYDQARMSMAIRACLMSRNNQRNISEPTRPSTSLSNRSVPDIETRSPQTRFREAIFNRLIGFRTRMQQSRIDNIERQIESVRNRWLANPAERNRALMTRKNLLSQNRHAPYANVRYLATNRNISRNREQETNDNNSQSVINNSIGDIAGSSERRIDSVDRRGQGENSFSVTNFADALQQLVTRLGRPSVQPRNSNDQMENIQSNQSTSGEQTTELPNPNREPFP